MGYKIGIDASRNHSGGARAHLIGIISQMQPMDFGIEEVHLWSYEKLLDQLPEFPWLIKHCPPETEMSMIKQLWWQFKDLPNEIKRQGCDVLLNTTGSTVCRFSPCVTMSRDMLSFERREIGRYEIGRDWLRLFFLRFIRIRAFKHATGVLFLTNYAADVIQTWTGKVKNYRVIPHGIGNNFKENQPDSIFPINGERNIRCVYVSNVARYKHQWNVASAISILYEKNYEVELTLIGGGKGPGQKRLEDVLKEVDPNQTYIKQLSFIQHEKIPAVLAKTDIFIFASSCENMPNTLVEAMACGIPIACSNLGPMPEVLQDGGEYFDPENIASITEAVETLILDEEKRIHSAQRSKELSESYSWNRCSNETLNYLKDIILQKDKQPEIKKTTSSI